MGEFLLELVLSLLVDIVLVPIKLILATPIILVISLFGGEGYTTNVKNYYKRLWDWHKPHFKKEKK